MKKTVFGVSENVASVIAYLGFFVTGFIMFVFERENKTVRFHGLQSLVLFGLLGIVRLAVRLLLGWLPLIGGLLVAIPTVLIFVSWVFLMLASYKGIAFKVPILGDVCWAQVHKE